MTERTEVLFAPYVTVIANADGTHSVSIDWSDTCQGEVLRNADGVVLAASPSLDENPERVEEVCNWADTVLIPAIDKKLAKLNAR